MSPANVRLPPSFFLSTLSIEGGIISHAKGEIFGICWKSWKKLTVKWNCSPMVLVNVKIKVTFTWLNCTYGRDRAGTGVEDSCDVFFLGR